MSGSERWLAKAQTLWRKSRRRLRALASGQRVTPEQLASADAVSRWRAVRTLRPLPRPDFLPALLALTDDADPMVRAAVVDALTSWGPDIALSPIRQALAAHPGPMAAAALLEALARLPEPDNRSTILPYLSDADEAVRAAGLMALAALCDDSDLPRLTAAWAQESIRVQRAIMTRLCAPAAGPLVQQALSADDSILRQRAAQAHLHAKRPRSAASTPGGVGD